MLTQIMIKHFKTKMIQHECVTIQPTDYVKVIPIIRLSLIVIGDLH